MKGIILTSITWRVGLVLLLLPYGIATAGEVTVSGKITSGSSLGSIFDGNKSYEYGGTTRNLAALSKGCPVRMGETAPCIARFIEADGFITKMISARQPSFGGRTLDKPGSVFDAFVCDQKDAVGYDAKVGCQHFDELTVEVIAINRDISKIRWNGQEKYVLTQRTIINCHGTSISAASYLGGNFPPGLKRC